LKLNEVLKSRPGAVNPMSGPEIWHFISDILVESLNMSKIQAGLSSGAGSAYMNQNPTVRARGVFQDGMYRISFSPIPIPLSCPVNTPELALNDCTRREEIKLPVTSVRSASSFPDMNG
jgi:hypothetical protein